MRNIPVHANFPKLLKELRGLDHLDGDSKWNNIYSKHLVKKLAIEVAKAKGVKVEQVFDREILDAFVRLIRLGMKDDWIRKNMTSIKFIYYNFNKILGK